MSTTIRLPHITRKEFDAYFHLDSPGSILVKQAAAAGETIIAVQAIEAVCIVNKFYEIELRNRLAKELAPFGKAEEYLRTYGTGPDTTLVVQTLGRKRLIAILREVMDEVRRQADIGRGKTTERKRATSRTGRAGRSRRLSKT